MKVGVTSGVSDTYQTIGGPYQEYSQDEKSLQLAAVDIAQLRARENRIAGS